MPLKMETPEAKLEFAKRKETIEWPFGNIKQNLKFTKYYTRELKQIQTKNNLIYISHNLKRILQHNNKTTKTNTPQKTQQKPSKKQTNPLQKLIITQPLSLNIK